MKLIIYKDYDVLEELRKIRVKAYQGNWTYDEHENNHKEIYNMLSDLMVIIEKSVEVMVKDKK